jgi:coproporphyrinogen III oxidase-like Fe-S oxidoreductase
METYSNAILKEIERYPLLKIMGVSCVDIGGGTPTILPESALDKLLSTVSVFLKSNSSSARSIETTPKQASSYPAKLNTIHSYGFNRISMGVQSFSSTLLKNINRKQHVNTLYELELAFAQNREWVFFKQPNLYLINENFSNLYFLRSLFYSRSAKQWLYAQCHNGKKV